jgi:transcription termination factor Rho
MLKLEDIKKKNDIELIQLAQEMNITSLGDYSRHDLVFKIMEVNAAEDGFVYANGVLEILPDGYGFLRSSEHNYVPNPDDVYVSPSQIKRFSLKKGDTIFGQIRPPKENERFYALLKVDAVNFDDPEKAKFRKPFEKLTPLYADSRINLESNAKDYSLRIMNFFTPMGKGQRALITAPPRTGKTVILQKIANAITGNHPEIYLIVLLMDERPEEVTDMARSVKAEVIASTFDEPADRHVQVAEMVSEKAKRLVEYGYDVVILMDSITRLARAYNMVEPHSGKILSGGVDANSLHKPKRFFGAARNIENGGSLSIIATALIETGSKMDEVIFEEFKGTGNMEIVLDRGLSDRRIFPAIDLIRSGTRKEELLLTREEIARSWVLRKMMADMSSQEAIDFVLEKMRATKSNEEFLKLMNS